VHASTQKYNLFIFYLYTYVKFTHYISKTYRIWCIHQFYFLTYNIGLVSVLYQVTKTSNLIYLSFKVTENHKTIMLFNEPRCVSWKWVWDRYLIVYIPSKMSKLFYMEHNEDICLHTSSHKQLRIVLHSNTANQFSRPLLPLSLFCHIVKQHFIDIKHLNNNNKHVFRFTVCFYCYCYSPV